MQEQILKAIEVLKKGGLVVFPTETVYGLGADARNEQAIKKVFAVKGRPAHHPLIVHLASLEQLNNWAVNIPESAIELAKYFWPGPLTIILQKHPQVSNLITGNQNTIAIRMPRHPLTLEMLQQFGSAIVGPSANSYGKISPTTVQHIARDLGNKVDYILDGGPCEIGIESTIVNFTSNIPQILRQGSISAELITKVVGISLTPNNTKPHNIRTPGSSKTHYAPSKPLYLSSSIEFLNIAKLAIKENLNYSYLSFQKCPTQNKHVIWLQAPDDPTLYAKNLYAYLHQLDVLNNQCIVVEMPPLQPAWTAIIDRLTRASKGKISINNNALVIES